MLCLTPGRYSAKILIKVQTTPARKL